MSTTPSTPGDALPPDDSARGQKGNLEPKKLKRRKRRRALKISLGVVLFIIVLVALAPTIISMGWVRQMVLDRVNADYINGRVEIADWSFGWFTSPRIEGIKIYDTKNAEVAEVHSITSDRSILQMLGFNLGVITVDGFNPDAHIDHDGNLNLASLIKPSSAPPSTTPLKLPNLRCELNVTGAGGTYTDDRRGLACILDSLKVHAKLASFNDPIEFTVDVRSRAQGKSLGEEQIDGSALIAQNFLLTVNRAGQIQPASASVDTKYTGVDTSVVADVLQLFNASNKLKFAGPVDGEISAVVKSEDDLSLSVHLNWNTPSVTANDDTVRYASVSEALQAGLKNGQITMNSKLIAVHQDPAVHDDDVIATVDTSVALLQHTAMVLTAAVYRLTDTKLPPDFKLDTSGGNGAGTIVVSGDLGIPALLNQLQNTIPRPQGATLTGGRYTWTLTHDLAHGTYALQTGVTGLAGTNNGAPVAIPDFAVKLVFTASADAASFIKDIQLGITGGFINFTSSGATLTSQNIQCSISLHELRRELAQLFVIPDIDGTIVASVQAAGDPAHISTGIVHTTGQITCDGVVVKLPGGGSPIAPKQLSMQFKGDIQPDPDKIWSAVNNISLRGKSSSGEIAIDADVQNDGNRKISVPRVDLSGQGDLAGLQQEFGGIFAWFAARQPLNSLPPIFAMLGDDRAKILSATFSLSGAGEFNTHAFGWTKPLTLHLDAQKVQFADPLAGAQTYEFPAVNCIVAGSGTASDQNVVQAKNLSATLLLGSQDAPVISPLVITGDGSIDPNTGALSIQNATLRCQDADLAKLQQVYAPILPYCLAPVPAGTAPTLTQQVMQGVLKVASARLSLSAKGEFQNDRITTTEPFNATIDALILVDPAGKTIVDVDKISNDAQVSDDPKSGIHGSEHLAITGLTYEKLTRENIVVDLSGTLSEDYKTLLEGDFSLQSSFAKNIGVSHVQVTLGDTLTMIHSAAGDVQVDSLDAARVLAVLKTLGVGAVAESDGRGGVTVIYADASAPATPPSAPLPELQSGTVNFSGSLAGGNLSGNYLVHAVVFQRPDDKKIYAWPGDITGQIGANAVIDGNKQLQSITVSKLSSDAGIAKVSLAGGKPITLSHLAGFKQCQVNGVLAIDGQIGPICRAAEYFTRQAPNALPYGGTCHLQEGISKNDGSSKITLTGGGSVEHFAAYGPPPPRTTLPKLLFTQDQFTLAGNFDYDLDSDSLIINPASPVGVDLPGVVTVNITGSLAHLAAQRNFDGFTVESKYNLEKLWPIAKPLLSPDMQTDLADLVITGNYDRIFHLSGSYPAGQTFAQNIPLVGADGRITVEKLATHGATIENFDLPVLLHEGVARTVYVDKPEGQNAPIPGTFNGGTLDPGVLSADFRGSSPLVTMEHTDPQHPHMVLKGASINPTFANSFFGKFLNNPAFAGASEATGNMDVTVLDLRTTPIDGTYANQNPQNPEHVHIVWSVHGLHLGAPLISQIPGANIPMDITDADATIEQGVLHEDTTLMVGQSPMRIWGAVGLQSNKFIGMQIQIPLPLLASLIPNQGLMAFMPKSITIPIEGTPDHPIIRIDKAIGKLVQDAVKKALLGGIVPGNNGGGNGGGGNNGGGNNGGGNNPLNGLLKGLTGHH